jgi:adenylosuccinate lyase
MKEDMMRDKYENPLVDRYASKEMNQNWSPQKKFSTWRRLWLALATAEKELGLPITEQQIEEMSAHLDDIDFDLAAQKEKEFRHDVMSHVHTFGTCCPSAMPVIHLGATSCYVGDNTDLIQLRDGMKIVRRKLLKVIEIMGQVADQYKALPTLGFTHYQPAQLTTVGKRVTLWLQDMVMDFERLEYELEALPFRGVKGTTGTQASFLALFDGDHEKVKALNSRVGELMGFTKVIPVSGQTYTRKIDYLVLSTLSGIAQSAYKMAGDIRLLANLKEIEEPFEKNQIGSSAMAYKRNPMRSERICSLARYVMSLVDNAANTHANQWFERTLDDSANRRISLPEAFLSVDVILSIVHNVMDGLQVWPQVIRKRVDSELPFMATENIIMACVKAGGDRQELHEAIRTHSMDAGRQVKEFGRDNDLMSRLAKDPVFEAVKDDLADLLDPSLYVGRSPEQVDEFLSEVVNPLLARCQSDLEVEFDSINV